MLPAFRFRTNKLKLVTVLAAVVLLTVVFYGRRHASHPPEDAKALDLLREAYAAILTNHVEKPDSKKLVLKMVDGMLAALDPHSAYLPPEPYHEMEVQMSGSFGGVGIELGTKEGRLTVIAPIDDTPAFRAGIQPNDHIWKIDGTPTDGMNIAAAVKRMRGEKGTPVTLTIMRGENARPLVFKLVRDIIKIKSLKAKLLDSGYGFIRISQFQERTGGEFKEALKDLHVKSGGKLKGLILDLRYILINGGSASASEIVAGAMQDHKRAIVMGTQSFGKGSVQSVIPMKGNAALKLTTARYYTPSGRSIQAKGIVPDIEVAAIRPVAVPVLPKQGEIKEKDLNNRLAPVDKPDEPQIKAPDAVHGQSADKELQNDFQLRRAVELLQSLAMLQERGLTIIK